MNHQDDIKLINILNCTDEKELLEVVRRKIDYEDVVQIKDEYFKKVVPCRSNDWATMIKVPSGKAICKYRVVVKVDTK